MILKKSLLLMEKYLSITSLGTTGRGGKNDYISHIKDSLILSALKFLFNNEAVTSTFSLGLCALF